MRLDQELATFIESPVMIIVGSRSDRHVPEIARAIGARASPSHTIIDLFMSEWQWPETILNLRSNGRIAVTFARPSDYVSFQIKGEVLALDAPTLEDRTTVENYIASVTGTLAELGISRFLSEPWQTDQELVVVRFRPEEVYVQTPGARAGQSRGAIP